MNRRYTRELYLERVARLRQVCPDIAISTDFIVGFPGETDADFEATLDLVERVAFDGIFAFMYSDRLVAPASRFDTKIDPAVKKERLQWLLHRQEGFTLNANRALVGSVQEILVEGSSTRPGLAEARNPGRQWSGRTRGNKIVNFNEASECVDGVAIGPGIMVDVGIEKAYSHSLWGRPQRAETEPGGLKGEPCHAA
jgi:tRNA-2-methylthio-N6-dimethylallyladenosine synthase